MDRQIIGFHQDEEQHWVAELECGHNQHVRHNPPWTNRPWVVTPEGRAKAVGQTLACRKCDAAPDDGERRASDGSSRRAALAQALAATALWSMPRASSAAEDRASDLAPARRWYEAAASMERLARSWGDQPYGAVLVAGGTIIGRGPSRVVQLGDPTAHAEREAIRDAQRRLGRNDLAGSVLYSTSRPCRACEGAAAEAKVTRMFHGPELSDAGEPQASAPGAR